MRFYDLAHLFETTWLGHMDKPRSQCRRPAWDDDLDVPDKGCRLEEGLQICLVRCHSVGQGEPDRDRAHSKPNKASKGNRHQFEGFCGKWVADGRTLRSADSAQLPQ